MRVPLKKGKTWGKHHVRAEHNKAEEARTVPGCGRIVSKQNENKCLQGAHHLTVGKGQNGMKT